jgi:hypothetical protein
MNTLVPRESLTPATDRCSCGSLSEQKSEGDTGSAGEIRQLPVDKAINAFCPVDQPQDSKTEGAAKATPRVS